MAGKPYPVKWEIIVTDLFNYGMPLIRYKIGDVAIVTDRKCPCGSNLPLIDKIIGEIEISLLRRMARQSLGIFC